MEAIIENTGERTKGGENANKCWLSLSQEQAVSWEATEQLPVYYPYVTLIMKANR